MAAQFRYFHFSIPKVSKEMDKDELEQECESAEDYIRRCREIGQGVNSKESVRYRDCCTELLLRFNLLRTVDSF